MRLCIVAEDSSLQNRTKRIRNDFFFLTKGTETESGDQLIYLVSTASASFLLLCVRPAD